MKETLKQLNLDVLYCIDVETYYDSDYSLRKMPTTEYICDPRFELQTVSVQEHRWKKPRVFTATEFKRWAAAVNWSRAGMVGHHCQFDALIVSRYCGVKPAFYFDTLSMARPVMPIHIGGSLKALTEAFGREGKKRGQALVNVMGRRLKDFTKDELKQLKLYNGDDVEDTLFVFNQLLPHTPINELKLIDRTVRMYAVPRLLLDKPLLIKLGEDEVKRKAELVDSIGADKKQLMSNDQFAELLRAQGVDPPMKTSPTTGKAAYAFAKQDLDFKALLDHEDPVVAALVEARLGVKSTIAETRAIRLANRADFGPAAVYLNYAGAKTLRWSGGDSVNFQNMGRGSPLRTALQAPPGHDLIIADLAQIEARINAWFNGQQNIVDAFANGQDVYALAASGVYGRPINKDKDPLERFVGKVMVLALGYQAGGPRFAQMLRIGQFGPPVAVSDQQAADLVKAWRAANPFIVAGWKRANNNMRSAFMGQQRIDDKVISYIGYGEKGVITMPNGTYIRYDKLQFDDEGVTYAAKYRRLKDGSKKEQRTRLYGGIVVENYTQGLARVVIGDHIVQATDEFKNAQLVMTTHDEIVLCVPQRSTRKVMEGVRRIMSTPPSWAPDLPLAVDIHHSKRYDK